MPVPKRIGVDFDNTIVSYEGVFHRVARERGMIPAGTATGKDAVRDYLRAAGREAEWTELQGHVYGERMAAAKPYPGVFDFFRRCGAGGVEVFVISHKTPRPYAGAAHDLPAAARAWMEAEGFFAPERLGLDRARVYFEPTKDSKLARIADLGCTHFIDDLPEFLAEPKFPKDVVRILFDPTDAHPSRDFPRVRSWPEFATLIFGQSAEAAL